MGAAVLAWHCAGCCAQRWDECDAAEWLRACVPACLSACLSQRTEERWVGEFPHSLTTQPGSWHCASVPSFPCLQRCSAAAQRISCKPTSPQTRKTRRRSEQAGNLVQRSLVPQRPKSRVPGPGLAPIPALSGNATRAGEIGAQKIQSTHLKCDDGSVRSKKKGPLPSPRRQHLIKPLPPPRPVFPSTFLPEQSPMALTRIAPPAQGAISGQPITWTLVDVAGCARLASAAAYLISCPPCAPGRT
jgi:hypothetical protein